MQAKLGIPACWYSCRCSDTSVPLRISTRTVCGHLLREFESTHSNVCKGSLQKTRGVVCKVTKKMWRRIAVLLKPFSPIFYIFLWWALHRTSAAIWRNICLIQEPNRETRNDAFFTFNLCCQWTQITKFWTFPSNRKSNKEKVESRWRWGTLGPAWLDPLGWPGIASTCAGACDSTHPP